MAKKVAVKNEAQEVTKASFVNTLKAACSLFVEVAKLDSQIAGFIEKRKALKETLKKTVSTLKLEVKALKLGKSAVAKELETLRAYFMAAHGDNSKVKSGKTTVSAQAFSDWKAATLKAIFPDPKKEKDGGNGKESMLTEEEREDTGNPVEGFEKMFSKVWETYKAKIDKKTALQIIIAIINK